MGILGWIIALALLPVAITVARGLFSWIGLFLTFWLFSIAEWEIGFVVLTLWGICCFCDKKEKK